MTLVADSEIGQYRILGKLGEGGMGEVYRALDMRLKREVALKVLPAPVAGDPERLARFEREAEMLAALNHPNIAAIYGIESSGETTALVMELIEGPTLADRISHGPLPIDEALHVAKQIALALEAAHEQNIVHRDLKPANVKLRGDGTVKVLDFGLAKAMDEAPGSMSRGGGMLTNSPTLTTPAVTGVGVILGTAAYMSPEQARGSAVDKRADIWAFGVVLFEMLSGKTVFAGTSITEVLAEVLKSDPPWNALPSTTPPPVRRLLDRCLQKKPRLRLRDIGDARIEIEEWLANPQSLRAPATAAVVSPARAHRWPVALAAASLLVAAATIAFSLRKAAPAATPSRTWQFSMGDYVVDNDFVDGPMISPDGRMIAFDGAGLGPLRVRDIDGLEPRTLAGTDGGDAAFWSPDSAFIGYIVPNRRNQSDAIWKVPAHGGTPVRICEAPPGGLWAAAWLPNGTIVFSLVQSPQEAAFYTVSDRGGRPTRLPDDAAGPFAGTFPVALDANKWLAAGGKKVMLRSPDGPEQTVPYDDFSLGPTAFGAGYLFHLNAKSDGIWATRFDPSRGTFNGSANIVAPQGRHPSVSQDGTLVYKTVQPGEQQLMWVDRAGNVLGTVGDPAESFLNPSLSPDGLQLAVITRERDVQTLWAYDATRGTRTKSNVGGGTTNMPDTAAPAWSPDSSRIAVSYRWDILAARVDASGKPDVLADGAPVQDMPSWSPDGKTIMFAVWTNGGYDLWTAPVGDQSGARKFLATAADEAAPRFAPDGQHVAYVSNESGRREVYVRDFPDAQRARQVSVNGGDVPRWSPLGDELIFVANNTLMSAAVQRGVNITFDAPKPLFSADKIGADSLDYDIAKDGKRFVVVRTLKRRERHAVVIENWLSRLTSR